jgi:hypothetical protein
MASTRNKNTPGNYCLDQRQNVQSEQWQLYANGGNGCPYDVKLAGNGLNPGQVCYNTLSYNPCDIESFLFGINSTNLVNPAPALTPKLKCLDTFNIYDKQPIIMPTPLAVPKNERPYPIP